MSAFKLKRISDGKEYEIEVRALLIGRSESCDINVTEGHPSREHARIAERDGAVVVEDLHSTNGTYVNNLRIEAATTLRPGDVVKFGDETFSVQATTEPEATVLMKSLGSKSNASATVIDDDEDEEDEDSTGILQVYALPPGWSTESTEFRGQVGKLDAVKKAAIDRYIDKFNKSLKGKTGVFFVFFSNDNPPVVKALVVKDNKISWSFGRSGECDLSFDHPCLSKSHALVTYSDNAWLLEDQESTNGVSIKGKKLKKIVLEDELHFEIGTLEVLVRFIR